MSELNANLLGMSEDDGARDPLSAAFSSATVATVSLYRALRAPNVPDLGPLFVRRGLDVSDDPGGYRPGPGCHLGGGGGAYFALTEQYAISLSTTRRYRSGIVVASLPRADFAAMCASGGILPDPLLRGVGFRVQPGAFAAFNAACALPCGTRLHYPPGMALPGGAIVP